MSGRDDYVFTPRESFRHDLGWCFRTEVNAADDVRDIWIVEDLDGEEVLTVYLDKDGWATSIPFCAGFSAKGHTTFLEALNTHVDAIVRTGGKQTDELFWCSIGPLLRWAQVSPVPRLTMGNGPIL